MEPKEAEKGDFLKKRQQYTIGVRRQNRQQLISKRRNINTTCDTSDTTITGQSGQKIQYMVDPRYEDYIIKFQKGKYFLEGLPELIKSLTDKDIIQQHYGAIGIRKIMSHVEDPPIQMIIDSGIVPRLIELIGQEEYPQLQLEATWSLANVVSGNPQQCQSVIDKGAIELFVKLVRARYLGIVEQAIWALGNIASDSSFNRDAIIRKGGIPNLIYVLKTTNCADIIQPGAWALSNLCRGTPLPNFQLIREGILLLGQIISQEKLKDSNTFSDCCWSISYSFPKSKQDTKKLISKQFITQMTSKIRDQDLSMIVPVVRILGHVTKISNSYVDRVLECPDIIDSFEELLYFQKKTVRMETLWVISNIASGPQNHINALLQSERLMAKILQLFQTDAQQIKRQICCIFANMTLQGNPQTVYNFFKSINITKFYIQCLASEDSKLVIDSLDNLFPILELGQKFKQMSEENPFVTDLVNMGAHSIIEELQFHDEQSVYESAVKIMVTFFEMDDGIAF